MIAFNIPRMLWLVLALLGCSRNNAAQSKRVEAWHRGDTAVIEPTAADFFESQVVDVKAGHLKVQPTQGGENMLVNAGDAYPLPAALPKLAPGAWAICQQEPHQWVACRVVRNSAGASDGGIETVATDAMGNELHLQGPQAIIEPTSLSSMNIQRRFEQTARREGFEKSLREAGPPRRQPGWQPAPRRLVLVSRQGQWFGAHVVESNDEQVLVRWDGDRGTVALPPEEVAPQPPACGTAVRGDRALRRPAGHGAAWTPVVVVSVDGTDASVEDVDRNRSMAQLRDLCPLGNPSGPSNRAN